MQTEHRIHEFQSSVEKATVTVPATRNGKATNATKEAALFVQTFALPTGETFRFFFSDESRAQLVASLLEGLPAAKQRKVTGQALELAKPSRKPRT